MYITGRKQLSLLMQSQIHIHSLHGARFRTEKLQLVHPGM